MSAAPAPCSPHLDGAAGARVAARCRIRWQAAANCVGCWVVAVAAGEKVGELLHALGKDGQVSAGGQEIVQLLRV
ncbi:hypothetical protein Q0Z83_039580 [Actinoplanes sichuanensis]|nr:hypothetical protein Q0Z83_039580 [Actinoplanes sichuanensis]